MKFLTSEKYYLNELSIKELLDEYKAIEHKMFSMGEAYIKHGEELTEDGKNRFERQVIEAQSDKNVIAIEIADRLTK